MHRSDTPNGKYASKHPPGTRVDPAVESALREAIQDGGISCADAHRIAVLLAFPPSAVGVGIDLLDASILRCQLGLFGYTPHKRVIMPAESVAPELEAKIRDRLNNGALPCNEAWAIAASMNLSRMKVAAACEALSIRVKPCQLGAF
jgi:hypothetical protein